MTYIFLIPAVIARIFDPTSEIAMSIGITTKEAKAETETHPVTVEAKISKCSIKFKAVQTFCASYSLNHFHLLLQ